MDGIPALTSEQIDNVRNALTGKKIAVIWLKNDIVHREFNAVCHDVKTYLVTDGVINVFITTNRMILYILAFWLNPMQVTHVSLTTEANTMTFVYYGWEQACIVKNCIQITILG